MCPYHLPLRPLPPTLPTITDRLPAVIKKVPSITPYKARYEALCDPDGRAAGEHRRERSSTSLGREEVVLCCRRRSQNTIDPAYLRRTYYHIHEPSIRLRVGGRWWASGVPGGRTTRLHIIELILHLYTLTLFRNFLITCHGENILLCLVYLYY